MTRPQLERAAIERASKASIGSTICIQTQQKEQTHPWVLGKVVAVSVDASTDAVTADAAARSSQSIAIDKPRVGAPALSVHLYEPLEPGSPTFTLSNVKMLVPAHRVRVIDVDLRAVVRPAVANPNPERARRAGNAASPPPPPPTRFRLGEESRDQIRAEMPTMADDWEVEKLLEYRSKYRKDYWLVKWKGFNEDRNTWEPWESFLDEVVQQEALQLKVAANAQ